ncbi:hypothetical protein N7510_006490 [Penicillium lagena]|uniref:uncharacterized protein n=1 Tax=Penicillium lagena TaxID=94218 RepID=UPI00254147D6|nr:uncharacterized protein N7510_006490 [Penicillium lagena]KAJ5613296.1 hypothetical protein N7510_006490 [Penicillium lagena]
MPKKHNRPLFSKPVTPAHHTLSSSGRHQDGPSRVSASTESSSVNDLISHLRRTQVGSPSDDGPSHSPRPYVSPRSVHPSLRNLLELPETPPPRPRPYARRVGVAGHRLRRTAGPPPPASWLAGSTSEGISVTDGQLETAAERRVYRLERLPGAAFPEKQRLAHMVLKSMALNWAWHLDYDGPFLAQLPIHLKMLLFSYMAVYARGQALQGRMRGLKPLILTESDLRKEMAVDDNEIFNTDSKITRLDMGNALGYWISFKQVTNELLASKPAAVRTRRGSEDGVLASWDEEADSDDALIGSDNPESPIPKTVTNILRFDNLRFLSFAHPHPGAASWNSLLQLLSRLSTITHLSLAHWPAPTRTPNAVHARIRHPNHHSLTFAYSGTDTYAALDNNWAEAAGLLRQLSRSTYCLKWLDLEGCSDWLPALTWTGTDPDGQTYRPGTSGPEWNGSWRDIEWIGLGPGWIPDLTDDGFLASPDTPSRPSRSLASSVHSPLRDADSDDLPWDVEKERVRYRRAKELEAYRCSIRTALDVHRHVLQIRRESRGKWVHSSLGIEDMDEDLVRSLLGPEYPRVFP